MTGLMPVLLGVAVAGGNPVRHAVLVGAGHGDAGEAELRFAGADARRIAGILVEHGGFAEENVTLLESAKAADLVRTLQQMNRRLADNRSEDLLFVFYSGHADAGSLHLDGTRLSMAELRDLVARSPAEASVLIVDACRSGALTRVKGGRPGPSFDVRVESPIDARGYAILTSAAAGEDAQESDELGASFFTHFLASALIGAADQNRDGAVTLGEAFSYAAGRTLSATAQTVSGPQHPTYRKVLGGRGDLVLTRPGSGKGEAGMLDVMDSGWYIVRKLDGAVVAEVLSEDLGRRVALDPGEYEILKRTPDYLLEARVSIRPRTATRLSRRQMRRIDYGAMVRKGGLAAWSLSAFAQGGGRSELADLGLSWHGMAGTRIDFPWISVEGRLSVGRAAVHEIETFETVLALAALEALDLGSLTVAGGVEVGGAWLEQRFTASSEPRRNSYGLVAGVLLVAQTRLSGPLSARVEVEGLGYTLYAGDRVEEANRALHFAVRASVGAQVYF